MPLCVGALLLFLLLRAQVPMRSTCSCAAAGRHSETARSAATAAPDVENRTFIVESISQRGVRYLIDTTH